MGVGKYHCDYCDKEFQDTPAARKRHLQGIQHQRNRALWYDSFNFIKDPVNFPASAQGIAKGFCNRFVNTGACPYGDSCKYIHPKKNTDAQTLDAQTLDAQRPQSAGNTDMQNFGMMLGNLPPSLSPPPDGGYPPLHFIDWE